MNAGEAAAGLENAPGGLEAGFVANYVEGTAAILVLQVDCGRDKSRTQRHNRSNYLDAVGG